jgi:hypothetical protein
MESIGPWFGVLMIVIALNYLCSVHFYLLKIEVRKCYLTFLAASSEHTYIHTYIHKYIHAYIRTYIRTHTHTPLIGLHRLLRTRKETEYFDTSPFVFIICPVILRDNVKDCCSLNYIYTYIYIK